MNGDDAAEQRFTALFRASYGRVLAYATRRTDRERARDIAADVFSTAWTHLDKVPADPLPWLYRTAWHAIGNDRRSQARQARLADRLCNEAATGKQSRDPAEQVAGAAQALDALRTLSPKDREVVQLLCWEQISVAQAAAVLECSEGAVKVRLHRARRRLATALSQPLDARGRSVTDMMPSTKEGLR